MQSSIIRVVFGSGSGFVFSILAVDVLVAFIIIYVIMNVIAPMIGSYKRAKALDVFAKGPEGHWFYGHTGKVFGKTPHERITHFSSLSKTFPTMFNTWRGPAFSTLSLLHQDTAIAMLSSGAPKDDFAYRFLLPWLGDGLLISKGKKWQRNRHLLTPAFHFSILKPYAKVFNSSVLVMLDKWKARVGQPLEISEDVSLMTLDSLLQCAMSSKTDCQHVKGGHPYIKAIQDLGKNLSKRFQNPFYLIDWIWNLSTPGRKFNKDCDVVHEHAEKIIADRRKVAAAARTMQTQFSEQTSDNSAYSGKRMLDFLDILLQTKDDEGKGLTDAEIRAEVDTFLFEGHDTTASGISWGLYNLAKYPEFQAKCRQEVNAVVGQKENVEWNDMGKFPYLTMFIKESLRLRPPVVTIGRNLQEPLNIRSELHPGEVTIPKGTNVGLSIFSLHRNPHMWENPEEFNPERFTKENCAKRSPHAYVPFSAGSRNCIGQNFAMNEMKTAFAQTLRRYRLYLDEDTPEPKMEIRPIMQNENGMFIKLQLID